MDKVYRQLARHLDEIPNGFPATESGVELKILAKLFSPEEAELACRLSLEPQTANTIAGQTGSDERETFVALKGMVKKGLIEAERGEGGLSFKLIPFIVGFYEHQNARIDEEFARLFEDYYHEALYKMMTMKPSVHRVIPVEKTIALHIEVMPYERASFYIENARAWGVLNCICRVQRRLIGKGCDHSLENCLVFSSRANAFDRTEAIRAIGKQEALDILAQADKEGLVHSTSNMQQGVTYICNCCICCCGVMRGVAEYGSENAIARSDFYATVDDDACIGCGVCVDRCQFKAITIDVGIAAIDRARCFGCGLCVTACADEALRLTQKPAAETEPPPLDESRWRKQRAKARQQGKSSI
jgi:electron transport complex protein RnfB